jgi:alpha-amylase
MTFKPLALSVLLSLGANAAAAPAAPAKPFLWNSATVYFLLTDRFHNADPRNDLAYGRKADAGPLRGFMGGDLKGVTAKIEQGYFDELGVNILWITPPVEQIHASTDEGTGISYGYHGYWAKDFTRIDANLGTEADLRALVDAAHARGIRVLLDVVMNHIGPSTAADPAWPADWVRMDPPCTFKDPATTVDCVLVKNLPDLLTGSDKPVALPPQLAAKWKREGRYTREVRELDAFFKKTGYPRAPRYYLMKWHADWVRKFGFDGFRADTVKHVQPGVWKELKTVASAAFEDWKRANPAKRLGDDPFFMTSEVFNYGIRHGRAFDLGDGKPVDWLANGFDSMINFTMAQDAKGGYDKLFSEYAQELQGPMKGYSVINYLSSHDDGAPFDPLRTRPFEAANKLLLVPGTAQIYYGDESARVLTLEGAVGDANLRSFMNWDELANNAQRDGYRVAEVRRHWALLGQFRRAHPAIGAGVHRKLADRPYTFARTLEQSGLRDRVVVALDLPGDRPLPIEVGGVFAEGETVTDHYSGKKAVVTDGKVLFEGSSRAVLIAK